LALVFCFCLAGLMYWHWAQTKELAELVVDLQEKVLALKRGN